MATLVFTAIGTAVGGPLGGAIGSLIGNQIDRAVAGGSHREGPRLKELAVSTSSYGSPIPRHHGTMRSPGTIVWATDLAEQGESSGGGKGSPSVTSYSYSVSFAVALSSRPIRRVGRIWADGNLLRGSAGDLKTGGKLRVHTGHGDQAPDPLIASAIGPACPAFRGLAYCVFESLQLADFGNRIPALTFEVVADEGEVSLAELVAPLGIPVESSIALEKLTGFADEGGPIGGSLAALADLFPLACDAGGSTLSLLPADSPRGALATLPEASTASNDGESFAPSTGEARRRKADAREIPDGLRYYDIGRDYQPGLQRADGRARPGRSTLIEFPGALAAVDARALANSAAERASWSRELMAWRTAEIDPALVPGSIARVPGKAGSWLVESWEWREQGLELELRRLPRGPARRPEADPGTALVAPDRQIAPTLLETFEVPWDGIGSASNRQVLAAASSVGDGWAGAMLYAQHGSDLVPLGGTGRRRCVIGTIVGAMAPARCHLIDPRASVDVQLVAPALALENADLPGLAQGRNRALIGTEVVQFAGADSLGNGHWRLSGLLRGRGGTEKEAMDGHPAGAAFALLDDHTVALDPAIVGTSTTIVALGIGDNGPVSSELANPGLSTRPLSPVHPQARIGPDGSLQLGWCRRARGGWQWPDEIELPLNEEREAYQVGIGPVDAPLMRWEATEPRLQIAPTEFQALKSEHPRAAIWVRQIGTFAMSHILHLYQID